MISKLVDVLKAKRDERQRLQDQVDASATVIAVLLAENDALRTALHPLSCCRPSRPRLISLERLSDTRDLMLCAAFVDLIQEFLQLRPALWSQVISLEHLY